MKKVILSLFSLAIIFTGSAQQVATAPPSFHAYEVSYDTKNRKVLRGLISRDDIENDTAFTWFKKNYNLGRPDTDAVAAFKRHAGDFTMLIFGGTWCPDTQNLLPEFYRLADAAGYADSNIAVIGVDHNKTTLDNLEKIFNVTNVPTFIVIKNGREAGRVVEYGESGEAMKELGKIVEGL
ncbi:TlpA family protein disulfide reductase [Parafilimonas sp.]|uniref:TlpA family protein disulfide reductase n=1 Tax=Parafilimonas sp. TaxID=1969739 RepID=UPI0039E541B4